MFFRIGLSALIAAKSLKTIAMLPELPASNPASRAIHVDTIQQAVAVCQAELR
jgi:hypothetical protein